MSKSAQDAYDEIVAHIKKQGGAYHGWYAGIASVPEQRLFSDHQVSKDNGWWIHRQCASSENARNVEKALLNLGCDGGSGGGDNSTVYVYAYLKTNTTNP